MPNIKSVIITKNVPVKDAAGEHGKDIGFIWGANTPFFCSVDFDAEDDKWVPITNPNPWQATKKQGWIKKSWCIEDTPNVTQLIVTVYDDGTPPTVKVLS